MANRLKKAVQTAYKLIGTWIRITNSYKIKKASQITLKGFLLVTPRRIELRTH
jgi:hypothetical protein